MTESPERSGLSWQATGFGKKKKSGLPLPPSEAMLAIHRTGTAAGTMERLP
jgi:hypothetical protein